MIESTEQKEQQKSINNKLFRINCQLQTKTAKTRSTRFYFVCDLMRD